MVNHCANVENVRTFHTVRLHLIWTYLMTNIMRNFYFKFDGLMIMY